MQFKHTLLFAAAALVSPHYASRKICSHLLFTLQPAAFAADAVKEGDVFTATRVIHTIIKESPYMVDRTTTIVWT